MEQHLTCPPPRHPLPQTLPSFATWLSSETHQLFPFLMDFSGVIAMHNNDNTFFLLQPVILHALFPGSIKELPSSIL